MVELFTRTIIIDFDLVTKFWASWKKVARAICDYKMNFAIIESLSEFFYFQFEVFLKVCWTLNLLVKTVKNVELACHFIELGLILMSIRSGMKINILQQYINFGLHLAAISILKYCWQYIDWETIQKSSNIFLDSWSKRNFSGWLQDFLFFVSDWPRTYHRVF